MKYFIVLLLMLSTPAIAQQAIDNADMARIYEADQAIRTNFPQNPTQEFIQKSIADDKARKLETAALVKSGALHSGLDYRRAAFIFQHGDKPGDYLLAHTLAMVAMSKGDREASWIAAATLDRYLQSVAHPQIYGTQFNFPTEGTAGQDPYDRTLISDALRAELRVPTQAEQEKRRASMEAEQRKP